MAQILVAYFSCSGTTKKVAEKLAQLAGADLFEIAPEVPYTKADLNWMNKKSRSSVEMNDRNSRPAIASRVDDIAGYTHILVGFPVWWYREPSIIDTFVESYDLSGKTIIPFCTSGGSGLGDTSKNLQALVPGATVTEGMKFSSHTADKALKDWLERITG